MAPDRPLDELQAVSMGVTTYVGLAALRVDSP